MQKKKKTGVKRVLDKFKTFLPDGFSAGQYVCLPAQFTVNVLFFNFVCC